MEQERRRIILVPLDFTGASRAALPAARRLGELWGARVQALYVERRLPPGLSGNVDTSAERRRLQDYVRDIKSRFREVLGDYPWVGVRVEEGSPMDVLRGLAAQGAADLIVMGTRGRPGISRLLRRSTAEAVVRDSRVPVLTVQSSPAPGWPRRILVPMKFAAYADEALTFALGLASLARAEVAAVHVLEEGEGPEAARALEEHLMRVLGEKRMRTLEFHVESGGMTPRSILSAAARLKADMIVLAAHHRPAWRGLALGMTAQGVLRRSTVPVLSWPSYEARRRGLENLLLARVLTRPRGGLRKA